MGRVVQKYSAILLGWCISVLLSVSFIEAYYQLNYKVVSSQTPHYDSNKVSASNQFKYQLSHKSKKRAIINVVNPLGSTNLWMFKL